MSNRINSWSDSRVSRGGENVMKVQMSSKIESKSSGWAKSKIVLLLSFAQHFGTKNDSQDCPLFAFVGIVFKINQIYSFEINFKFKFNLIVNFKRKLKV